MDLPKHFVIFQPKMFSMMIAYVIHKNFETVVHVVSF